MIITLYSYKRKDENFRRYVLIDRERFVSDFWNNSIFEGCSDFKREQDIDPKERNCHIGLWNENHSLNLIKEYGFYFIKYEELIVGMTNRDVKVCDCFGSAGSTIGEKPEETISEKFDNMNKKIDTLEKKLENIHDIVMDIYDKIYESKLGG